MLVILSKAQDLFFAQGFDCANNSKQQRFFAALRMTSMAVRNLRKLGPRQLAARLRKIRCLLLDVDGVLTDGRLYFDGDGREFKAFDIHDGHGIAMAKRAGLLIGFVSGRSSEATKRRAADLGVELVMQEPTNKMDMVEQIKTTHSLTNAEICFVGDDLVDLPVLRQAGVAVAVANAVPEVRNAAHYVTVRSGGRGAVREVIDRLLQAQGKWDEITAKYFRE